MAKLFANSGHPDQTLCSVASDLGLQCLPNTFSGVSRLQWVKHTIFFLLEESVCYGYAFCARYTCNGYQCVFCEMT